MDAASISEMTTPDTPVSMPSSAPVIEEMPMTLDDHVADQPLAEAHTPDHNAQPTTHNIPQYQIRFSTVHPRGISTTTSVWVID